MEMQTRIQSSLIGLKYPTGRDNALKTGASWLRGKRQDDDAEGLWRVGNKIYDLGAWARNHPGGSEWITLTRGTDITEAFEAHHVTLLAEHLLPKFYVRDAVSTRACPLTFKPDGFYHKFKERAREALSDVDIHHSSWTSNLIADFLFITTITLCLIAAISQSWIVIVASGIFLSWTVIAGHNFLHQRDSFRMYYFDLLLMSSKEWRITHVLSHHLFTNTLLDMEISLAEPFLVWLPRPNKGRMKQLRSWLYSPLVYILIVFEQGLKRIYSIVWEWGSPEFRDAVPFLIPCLMFFVVPATTAFWTWWKIIAVAGFHFSFVSINAGHHHPDIFHDGDTHREDTDWGLAELDAVRDRVEIESSIFLILTHFGSHTLHHLLPTVDHAYLHLCEPAFIETCEEFGVDAKSWTQWELLKGQFKQLGKSQATKTPNIRK